MVSKAKSVKGSAAGIGYIQSDKELGPALELDRNGIIAHEPNEITKEFKLLQEANTRCDKNSISIVISPSEEKKFTIDELREVGKEHLKRLGLENNQYLMTLHQSTGKPHIHIIANRIDTNGKAFNDSLISKKCQEISADIAQENGLLTAKDWQKVRQIENAPIIKDIQNAHNFSAGKARDFGEYKDLMRGKGIKVHPTINKKGLLQGFRVEHLQSGLNFKSSEIGKNFGAKNLIMNHVKMPSLTPPLQQIAIGIVKSLAKQASRGMGIGF